MYAIVRTGGKQYSVMVGDMLHVELLEGEAGARVNLEVLMLADGGTVKSGAEVKDAKCTAEIVFNGRAKKINIFKYKAKKNVRKRQGHRQPFTELKILEIVG